MRKRVGPHRPGYEEDVFDDWDAVPAGTTVDRRDPDDLWTEDDRGTRETSLSRRQAHSRAPENSEDLFDNWDAVPAGRPADRRDPDDFWTESARARRAGYPRRRRKPLLPVLIAAAACILLVAGLLRHFRTRPPEAAVPPAVSRAPVASPSPTPAASPSPTPVPTPKPSPSAARATISGYRCDDPIYYFRAGLSPDDAALYDRICAALEDGRDRVTGIDTNDSDRVFRVFSCVDFDHPEYFWTGNGLNYDYQKRDDAYDGTLSISVLGDTVDRELVKARMADAAQSLKRSVGAAGDYEKALAVYEFVIDNTVYDLNYRSNNLSDVVLYGRGVCAGYAAYAQFLLQQLGIPAIFAVGIADGESHAWNIVRLDGEWYQFDATWGDPTGQPSGGDINQTKTFKYFCLTDAEMYLDHEADSAYRYPACTATACNYYVHEGRLTGRYDESWLLALMERDLADGRESIEFRSATQEIYAEYLRKLVVDERFPFLVRQLLGPAQTVNYTYSPDETLFILSFSDIFTANQ